MKGNTNRRVVFVVTHFFPYPPVQGNGLRIVKLVKWLHSQGYKVVLIVSGELEKQPRSQELLNWVHAIYGVKPALRTRLGRRFPRLRRLVWESFKPVVAPLRRSLENTDVRGYEAVPSSRGDEGRKKSVNSPKLAQLVSRLAGKYNPVGVFAEYIFLTDCFALLKPNTLKIVDTHDVFSLKDEQVGKYGIDDPWACTIEEERSYLLRCDLILAIQDQEARVLTQMVPEREVLTVGVDFEVTESRGKNVAPDVITFVGSDNPLNVFGLQSFFKECWPDIKQAHPTAVLNIVGGVGSLCSFKDTSVNYFPCVNNLSELYRQSRVVINPNIAGTGLKIKSIEALAHGKPLVAWPRGVEGLDYCGEAPYIKCESWTEFTAAVVGILQSEGAAQKLSARALAFAKVKFDPESVYGALRDRLQAHQTRNNPKAAAYLVR